MTNIPTSAATATPTSLSTTMTTKTTATTANTFATGLLMTAPTNINTTTSTATITTPTTTPTVPSSSITSNAFPSTTSNDVPTSLAAATSTTDDETTSVSKTSSVTTVAAISSKLSSPAAFATTVPNTTSRPSPTTISAVTLFSSTTPQPSSATSPLRPTSSTSSNTLSTSRQVFVTSFSPPPPTTFNMSMAPCSGIWAAWSSCSTSCGDGVRSREVVFSGNENHHCARQNATIETALCSERIECPHDCIGSWGPWDDCSTSCSSGTRSRTFAVAVAAAFGGRECVSSHESAEVEVCASYLCPVDCIGVWSSWSECSTSCRGGAAFREFSVLSSPLHGGQACSFENATVTMRPCNTDTCPNDCNGTWLAWSTCSATCGSGLKFRFFREWNAADYTTGGLPCVVANNTSEAEVCVGGNCATVNNVTNGSDVLDTTTKAILGTVGGLVVIGVVVLIVFCVCVKTRQRAGVSHLRKVVEFTKRGLPQDPEHLQFHTAPSPVSVPPPEKHQLQVDTDIPPLPHVLRESHTPATQPTLKTAATEGEFARATKTGSPALWKSKTEQRKGSNDFQPRVHDGEFEPTPYSRSGTPLRRRSSTFASQSPRFRRPFYSKSRAPTPNVEDITRSNPAGLPSSVYAAMDRSSSALSSPAQRTTNPTLPKVQPTPRGAAALRDAQIALGQQPTAVEKIDNRKRRRARRRRRRAKDSSQRQKSRVVNLDDPGDTLQNSHQSTVSPASRSRYATDDQPTRERVSRQKMKSPSGKLSRSPVSRGNDVQFV
eukprot:INCI11731.1.p1 GENE.INCI11731.1~~INCI11731.1.p1  ORF type:complete len:849 (-),score=115.01 INCI11731.1:47-2368(-)